MQVAIDCHVHWYPSYGRTRWLRNAAAVMRAWAPDATPVLCLAERAGGRLFVDWTEGRNLPEAAVRIAGQVGMRAAAVTLGDTSVWVVPGRQIVTRERLEILALAGELEAADGASAEAAIETAIAAGSLPVIAWAPGKWTGRRGACVRGLMERFGPDRVFLGDSSLRPAGAPWPRLIREGRTQGFRILAGSDPLPFAGEARRAGTYGLYLEGSLSDDAPVADTRALLRGYTNYPFPKGRRSNLFGVFHRLLRNEWLRRNRRSQSQAPAAQGGRRGKP